MPIELLGVRLPILVGMYPTFSLSYLRLFYLQRMHAHFHGISRSRST